jgi:hypothetical protein
MRSAGESTKLTGSISFGVKDATVAAVNSVFVSELFSCASPSGRLTFAEGLLIKF